MKDIDILGVAYSFPEIRDSRFSSLQEEISDMRSRIQDGGGEKRVLGIFRRTPPLGTEERLRLMEGLVERYDELMASLKDKIGTCTDTFDSVGDGVTAYFNRKVAELEAMERRRSALAEEARAKGQVEASLGFEAEAERIRALALNLTSASVLIIRKLRHALTALDTLVGEEDTQAKVLDSLKESVSFFRRTHEFTKDLDSLEEDIASVTRLALSFDSILRNNLGPLSILIDEVTKVDSRVAESLVEIERLSAQLESRKDVSASLGHVDNRIFDLLTGSQVKKETLDGIIAAMSDPATDLGEVSFLTELGKSSALDFRALTANMAELVRRGLADLRSTAPAAAAVLGPVPAPQVLPPPLAEPQPAQIAKPVVDPVAPPVLVPAIAPTAAPEPVADSTPAPAPEPKPEPTPEAKAEPEAPPSPPPPPPAWVSGLASNAAPSRPSPQARGRYTAAISRKDPTLIVFLLDRSGSMAEPYSKGLSKAQFLARTVDSTLLELAVRCNKADGTRDYFHIACIGYNEGSIQSAFPSPLGSADYAPISRIAASPLRIDSAPDGTSQPAWIEPVCIGGTPMRAAFVEACRFVATWCDAHPSSYPPTVINVSDGQSTDGDPSDAADVLRRLHTDDGECLVYNLHVRSGGGAEVVFPDSASGLDEYGRLLFDMSSPFPPHIAQNAVAAGFRVKPDSRFFAYGAGAEVVSSFFNLGTRTTRLA